MELQITEPTVTDNTDEMTSRKSHETSPRKVTKQKSESLPKTIETTSSDDVDKKSVVKNEVHEVSKNFEPEVKVENDYSEEKVARSFDKTSGKSNSETEDEEKSNKKELDVAEDSAEKNTVHIEYERMSQEKIEIIKDIEEDSDEVCLKKKDGSSGALSRSDSFSVKEEIDKIERQIKALESRHAHASEQEDDVADARHDNDGDGDSTTNTRLSIQANRRHFFENMVDGPSGPVKLEFKKLPCEQKDIHVVRLTDPPVPVAAPRDPVKVIELHISEPIRHKPELLDEINPIPKPRRHSALSLKDAPESSRLAREKSTSPEDNSKRGKSF